MRFCTSVLVLGLVTALGSASAQDANADPRAKRLKQQLKQDLLKQKALKQNAAEALPLPGTPLDRFLRMTPEEQERALAQLPPERRAQLEERLRRFGDLPPEQRAVLERRYQVFVRLRPARQEAVRMFVQRLRQMPLWQRKAILESQEARNRFSTEELQLVRDVLGFPPSSDE